MSLIIFIFTSRGVIMHHSVKVVNCNYKSDLAKPINLSLLESLFPNSKLYSKPSQLIIKDTAGTLIFFSNGKHRVMGCKDELDATLLAYKYVAMIDKSDNNFPLLFAQSSTVCILYHTKIHLQSLAHILSDTSSHLFHYEPEIFPAVLIRKFKPLSVNVFSTGKIIICGVKDIEQVHYIMKDLCVDLQKCTL